MHELLSGDVPFAGSTALGVLHRHLYEPPVPVRRIRPEVPEALEAVVRRTRAYARRQLAWFRRDPRVLWSTLPPGPERVALAL